jgi:L-ascorbate metabolism protein UlaG (beta-lactamase superfamily)
MDRRSFVLQSAAAACSLLAAGSGFTWLYLKSRKFGAAAEGSRLERIRRSPNFRNGQFQNLLATPMMTGQDGGMRGMWRFFFGPKGRRVPSLPIPSVHRDLRNLPPERDLLVWLGHSSYLIQIEGRRFLIDPVMSGAASPVAFTTRAFPGSDPYTVDDLPPIDHLLISHDHWDHLDYETVNRLRPRVGNAVCGLGAGAHLERWGYRPESILEGDWGESLDLGGGFGVHLRTARHFSGRLLRRNGSLWASFVLITPRGRKLFLGGDGGYGPHFAKIGEEFGGFDLAMLECGQYNEAWRYVHMMPEETVQAARDLQAHSFFPVHNSKFCISLHDWDEPLRRVAAASGLTSPERITARIGELVDLWNPVPEAWWTAMG